MRSLASGAWPAGEHRLAWDGRDDAGHVAAAGIYLLTLEAGDRTLHRRLAFVK